MQHLLVITRRTSESIIIGDNIEIIISDISNDKVKICIDAPRDVIIMRKELLETSNLNVEANNKPDKRSLEQFKNLAKDIKFKDKTE